MFNDLFFVLWRKRKNEWRRGGGGIGVALGLQIRLRTSSTLPQYPTVLGMHTVAAIVRPQKPRAFLFLGRVKILDSFER
jgi:hypothetical protein